MKEIKVRVEWASGLIGYFSLEDDGRNITMPSSWPAGGCRQQLCPSGKTEEALAIASRRNWPYWIGGCGYSAVPRKIEIVPQQD